MLEWLSKMLDRLCAALGALIFVQFPLFVQQYMIRLSGHTNELRYQVQKMSETAKGVGKTLPEYIGKFTQSKDVDFSSQGELMESMVNRLNDLSDSLTSLTEANIFSRPFLFIYHSDWHIMKGAISSYRIGFTLTFESIIYAIVGVIVGYYTYQAVSTFCKKVYNGLSRAHKKEKNEK